MEDRISKLEEIVEQQNETIQLQNKKIEDLTGLISAAKSTTLDTKKPELPKTPTEPLEHKEKTYKWAAASFFLPGDSTRYLSQDVISDPVVIDKLLAVTGQRVLIEQA